MPICFASELGKDVFFICIFTLSLLLWLGVLNSILPGYPCIYFAIMPQQALFLCIYPPFFTY